MSEKNKECKKERDGYESAQSFQTIHGKKTCTFWFDQVWMQDSFGNFSISHKIVEFQIILLKL